MKLWHASWRSLARVAVLAGALLIVEGCDNPKGNALGAAQRSVGFSLSSSTNPETGTAIVYVKLTAAAVLVSPVSVDVIDLGTGSAASGVDYTALGTQTVTFTVGTFPNALEPVNVTVQPDADPEADETIVLRLQNASGASLGTRRNHTLTIIDDD